MVAAVLIGRFIVRMNGEIVESTLKTKSSYRAATISQQAIAALKTQKAKTNDEASSWNVNIALLYRKSLKRPTSRFRLHCILYKTKAFILDQR